MNPIRKYLVSNHPYLGKYKRLLVAYYNHIAPIKRSYSQHREDIFLHEELSKFDLKKEIYIDIGANHPTDISNTYLLYRDGYSGIVIDPNSELINLHKHIRKRDVALAIGCSNESSIMKFNISKTPVRSTFESTGHNLYKHTYAPVFKLTDVLKNIDFDIISLLSVDVEGLNLEVLEGAGEILSKCFIVCIEYDDENERKAIDAILEKANFKFLKCFESCNLIYQNKILHHELGARSVSPM